MRDRVAHTLPWFTALLLLIVVAHFWDAVTPPSRSSLRDVPLESFSSHRMIGLLRGLRNFHIFPSAEVITAISQGADQSPKGGILRYGTFPSHGGPTIESLVPHDEIAKGFPIVSLLLSPSDLTGSLQGIIPNRFKHGSQWERPAYFQYYDEGKLVLQSGVGVRPHGGKTRALPSSLSYRLYFRNRYGMSSVRSASLLDGGVGDLKTVIVHSDLRRGVRNPRDVYQFVNPLGYDLIRAAGGIASRTRPVKFYLNGASRGVFVLTERHDRHFLRNNFGHEDFEVIKTKGVFERGRSAKEYKKSFRSLMQWIEAAGPRLTLERANQVFDMESLVTWFLIQVLFGNTDAFQATMLRNRVEPDAKWFWAAYDVDHSFRDVYGNRKEYWTTNVLRSFLKDKRRRKLSIEARLISRLRRADPHFRNYVRERFSLMMNHLLTPEVVGRYIDYYDSIARRFEMKNRGFMDRIRVFFAHRPAVVRKQIADSFQGDESFKVRVNAPPGYRYEVDTFPKETDYEGWYFKGSFIRIRLMEPATQFVMADGVRLESRNGEVTFPIHRGVDLSLH